MDQETMLELVRQAEANVAALPPMPPLSDKTEAAEAVRTTSMAMHGQVARLRQAYEQHYGPVPAA